MVGFIRAAADWWIEHPDEMTRADLTEYLTTDLPEHLFPML